MIEGILGKICWRGFDLGLGFWREEEVVVGFGGSRKESRVSSRGNEVLGGSICTSLWYHASMFFIVCLFVSF